MSVPSAASDARGEIAVPHIGGGLNLRQRIVDILRASMATGQMRSDVVYSAPALARQFGVSSTPVREAMLDLAAEGLVEVVRNKGFRVVEPSEKQLDDITAVRMLIEVPTIAALAALAADGDHHIRDAVLELYPTARRLVELADQRNLVAFVDLDRQFHLSLLALAENTALSDIVGNLRARSRLTGLTALAHKPLVRSASEHVRILDLVLAGDQAAVTRLMNSHINHVRGVWAGRLEHPRKAGT